MGYAAKVKLARAARADHATSFTSHGVAKSGRAGTRKLLRKGYAPKGDPLFGDYAPQDEGCPIEKTISRGIAAHEWAVNEKRLNSEKREKRLG